MRLRLQTPDILGSRGGPLNPSLIVPSNSSSNASSPALLSPEFAFSASACPSSAMSTSMVQTPLTGSVTYFDWGMAGVKEENEEEEDADMMMI